MSDVVRFIEAAGEGDTQAVRKWLDEGIPVDVRDGNGRTALWCAIRKNHAETVIFLLDQGADPQAHFDEVRVRLWESIEIPKEPAVGPGTLLHEAAETDAVRSALVLVERGFDLEARSPEGLTPLAVAAYHSSQEMIDLLLERGVEVDALDNVGFAALDYAKSAAIVEKLLDAGAAPEGHTAKVAARSFYRRPLLIRTDASDRLRLLLKRGADPNACPGCVTWHAHYGRLDIVEALLAAGASADDRLRDASALGEAAAIAHRTLVDRLLKKGATSFDLALYCACGASMMSIVPAEDEDPAARLSIARMLLEKGADPNAADPRHPEDRTVHVAAERGHADLLRLLLAEGADAEAKNTDGQTPLHLAAHRGHNAVVELLLQAGVDPLARDKRGKTPFALARGVRSASLRILPLLRKAGGAPEDVVKPVAVPDQVPVKLEWEEGSRVSHPKFGDGEIEAAEGTGEMARVTVRFSDGSRKILARFLQSSA